MKIQVENMNEIPRSREEWGKWVSRDRIRKWEEAKTEKRKREVIAGEYLLNKTLFELSKERDVKELQNLSLPLDYQKNKHGAPYLPGNPFYFNWSHSGDYVALALSKEPVGIDLQKRKPYKDSVAKRYFTESVWEEMRNLNQEEKEIAFFRCWTLTEAWLKAKGCGFYQFEKPEYFSWKEETGVIFGKDQILWNYQFIPVENEYELCVVTKK